MGRDLPKTRHAHMLDVSRTCNLLDSPSAQMRKPFNHPEERVGIKEQLHLFEVLPEVFNRGIPSRIKSDIPPPHADQE
jgi:hypothetical protein